MSTARTRIIWSVHMWPALGWCDERICYLDILHARSTNKYTCKYLLIVLSATSHALACVLNLLTVSTHDTLPVLAAYFHHALPCVGMRQWKCYKCDCIERAQCLRKQSSWGIPYLHRVCFPLPKRQHHMRAATKCIIVDRGKCWNVKIRTEICRTGNGSLVVDELSRCAAWKACRR